jgi:hypothetical protein
LLGNSQDSAISNDNDDQLLEDEIDSPCLIVATHPLDSCVLACVRACIRPYIFLLLLLLYFQHYLLIVFSISFCIIRETRLCISEHRARPLSLSFLLFFLLFFFFFMMMMMKIGS